MQPTAILHPPGGTLIDRLDGDGRSPALLIAVLALLVLLMLFVVGFVWTLLRTISEMSANPGPGAPWLGTVAVLALLAGLVYLVLAQSSGPF